MRLLDRPKIATAPDVWPGLTLLAATALLEAEGEPESGQLAVAFNPCNRALRNGWELHRAILGGDMKAYDDGHPYEIYSCWNDDYHHAARDRLMQMTDKTWEYFYRLACIAFWGLRADPSQGADHYLNIELTKKIRGGTLPNWVDEKKITCVIGQHTFLKLWD